MPFSDTPRPEPLHIERAAIEYDQVRLDSTLAQETASHGRDDDIQRLAIRARDAAVLPGATTGFHLIGPFDEHHVLNLSALVTGSGNDVSVGDEGAFLPNAASLPQLSLSLTDVLELGRHDLMLLQSIEAVASHMPDVISVAQLGPTAGLDESEWRVQDFVDQRGDAHHMIDFSLLHADPFMPDPHVLQ
ncbi:hypothetical protein AWB66_03719 [Caballeronia telluris]|jgi:hypothetical protein|uniref:Uncharacterized protein n=2 Tax=Caballeronia telluris TaxID=326475 RepID=A0A158J1W5_9BURK|nr:hypothetical protein AWB66_03719 [Caballeronia telluris]